MKQVLSLLGVLLALTIVAGAETIRLSGENVLHTARGQDILIEGSHGNFVLSGSAGKVTVRGDHNDIVISEAAELLIEGHHIDVTIDRVGAVDLGGHHNDVVVRSGRPVVTRRGHHNDIVSTEGVFEGADANTATGASSTREEVVTRTKTLTLDGSAVTQTINAEGQDVILNGGANKLTLTGRANSVTINGAANKVTIESTPLITINGATNVIHYRSGNPRINDVGFGNKVSGP